MTLVTDRRRGLEPSPSSAEPHLLPVPPTDAERDSYFGPQLRWVPALSAIGSLLTAAAVWALVMQQPWAWPMLAVLALSSVSCLLMVLTSSRPRRETLATHRARVVEWQPAQFPSVDVLLPSAGEDLAVLRNTFRWVAELCWPGRLRVLVLDDSDRVDVAELAAASDFDYLVRPDRPFAKKAGNLRAGFDRGDGDFLLILDADFVPRADLLFELMPYFDDPRVGIVQSPQYFDLDKRMNWVQLSAGATQVLFYRWTQPSWDRNEAAICVGTSALYRRSAIASIGGFPPIEHSEDIHTGIRLTEAGSAVRYVPTVVTKGLCPDTLDGFLAQQYRWCSGSLSLAGSRAFHRMPLTWRQRLSYWAGFLYYFDTAASVFFTALPPILTAALVPASVSTTSFVLILAAFCARSAVVPLISDGRDSLIGLARIQTAYSLAHAVAIVDAARHRTGSWQPTGSAARSQIALRSRRLMRLWLGGVQLALWTLVLVRAPEYGWHNYWLMAAFALLQLLICYPLLLSDRLVGVTDPFALRRLLPDYLGRLGDR